VLLSSFHRTARGTFDLESKSVVFSMAPPEMVSITNSAALWPVNPKMYEMKKTYSDDPDIEELPFLRGNKYSEEQEKAEQFKKEQEELAKLGVVIKDNHMDGYKYVPPVREVEREQYGSGVLRPWETEIPYTHVPQCTSGNWKHTEVLFEINQGIAYVTMNRPGHNNAITDTLSSGIADAVCELRQRKDVRIAVLKANGKMFCAGGDPKGFQDAAAMSDADNKKSAVDFTKFLYHWQALPQFTIACVQGNAMGGGVGLCAMCDMVIAVKDAKFVLSEVKLGVIPATISPYVVAKIGVSNAKRLFCTAENIEAEQAQQMGLVQVVVDSADGFQDKLKQIAEHMTKSAPDAVHSAKKLVMNVVNQPMSEALIAYTASELARVRKTAESEEGMKALQEQRKPYWAQREIVP